MISVRFGDIRVEHFADMAIFEEEPIFIFLIHLFNRFDLGIKYTIVALLLFVLWIAN